jgi:hypothetical protein
VFAHEVHLAGLPAKQNKDQPLQNGGPGYQGHSAAFHPTGFCFSGTERHPLHSCLERQCLAGSLSVPSLCAGWCLCKAIQETQIQPLPVALPVPARYTWLTNHSPAVIDTCSWLTDHSPAAIATCSCIASEVLWRPIDSLRSDNFALTLFQFRSIPRTEEVTARSKCVLEGEKITDTKICFVINQAAASCQQGTPRFQALAVSHA